GLRNPYDFAFNADGELFTYDADMEWDLGAPWYRPTRLNHVTAGAEFGWRSGWAKWPDYFVDSLPTLLDLGPGSPTGIEFYNHNVYPESYRGALFGCDWATGKIHCVRLTRNGATYRGESEVFVAGRPLNATDIAVGPDGALYFCTGGRGTDGGVYRVRWTGESANDVAQGIDRALKQPQHDADWARARIAAVKVSLGDRWSAELDAAARDTDRELADRLRALDLMVLFGPRPQDELLRELSKDPSVEMRAKVARLMYPSTSIKCRDQLIRLLEDEDPLVRRVACESLTRSGLPTVAETHARMLTDKDRFVAFAARRSLEQLPTDLWAELVLVQPDVLGFCRGASALLACQSDAETAQKVLEHSQRLLEETETPYTQEQLASLLRVTQLALLHGKLSAENVPELGDSILARYPSSNAVVDRELVRLLVHLQVDGAARKFAKQLKSELPSEEKLHIGAYAAQLQAGWDTQSKLTLMKFYETARAVSGGYSVSAYVENFAREFFTKLSLNERRHILATGERWPASALSVLAKLPTKPDAEILEELRELDGRVRPLCADDDRFRRLRVGIVAVLGRSGEAKSLEYLRDVYRDEPDWRDPVAMSLTQHPDDDSWPYLVESLKTVQGTVAREVLAALVRVPQRPREAEPYRQVILLGLRFGDEGANLALELLNHWSGHEAPDDSEGYQEQLTRWQGWYAVNFPKAPAAELPVDSGKDKWSYEELLTYLESKATSSASAERGKDAFSYAQCIKCHRCGAEGETLGPDLTTVAQRFQKKEILGSIVYPSHIISDQYASQRVIANGRTYTGLVAPQGAKKVAVLLSDGQKIELAKEDIEETAPSRVSSMPEGLLNSLTLEQVADLFAFLEQNTQPDVAKQSGTSTR
ncbi:MAG: HEAT repeat domain-containing protein, partial [Aeoliella sp.]